jgi:osmotically-inducible protein OsmY
MRVAIGTLTCAIALFFVMPTPAVAGQQAAPTMQSDAAMATAISGRIDRDDSLDDYDVKVAVKSGVATLSGRVRTEAQKVHAGELAKAGGATRVDNQIVVDAAAGSRGTAGSIGDKSTAAAAKTKDAAEKAADKTEDAAEKAADKTENAAKDAADKSEDAAQKAWQKTKDGWEVVVDKTAAAAKAAGSEATDAWITTSIKTKFVGEDALKNSHIDVDTDNHVVTLKGTVASEAGRDRALDIVKHVDGVDRIVDLLTIAPK